MADKRKPILVICGPTASGKTKLAVNIAKCLDGEVISADSMQIYKGLDIGTAKPSESEKMGIKHHLLDVLYPNESFSVADYITCADDLITKLYDKQKTSIICGGTGQYISGLINGLSFIGNKTDESLRQKLWQREKNEGIEALLGELKLIDPEYAKTLHVNNKARILRALELYCQTGKTMSQQLKESLPIQRPYNELVIGLNFTNRSALYDKINMRVDIMLENGLIDEAKNVFDNRDLFKTAVQAIGYKELFAYFEATESLKDCVDKLKQASRNYAKRQLTWFKRIDNIVWLDAENENLTEQVVTLWEKHNGRAQ